MQAPVLVLRTSPHKRLRPLHLRPRPLRLHPPAPAPEKARFFSAALPADT